MSGIYIFEHRRFIEHSIRYNLPYTGVEISYVIGWTKDIPNIRNEENYEIPKFAYFQTFPCTYSAKRFHKIINMLDADGCPIDPKYNDHRVRVVDYNEKWQIAWIKAVIDEVLAIPNNKIY